MVAGRHRRLPFTGCEFGIPCFLSPHPLLPTQQPRQIRAGRIWGKEVLTEAPINSHGELAGMALQSDIVPFSTPLLGPQIESREPHLRGQGQGQSTTKALHDLPREEDG